MGGIALYHAGKSQWPKLYVCPPTENIDYISATVEELAIFFQVFKDCTAFLSRCDIYLYLHIICVYILYNLYISI